MRIESSTEAREVIARAKQARRGTLTITIGTGCCESTAPFLYEDFWPGPDQEVIGEIEGVSVYAPDYLRRLYPDSQVVTVEVVHEMVESLSIETEFGCRLALRGQHTDSTVEPETCAPEAAALTTPRAVAGRLPEALRAARIR